jgi:RimJ/RimL family protein N-acetyltransferase
MPLATLTTDRLVLRPPSSDDAGAIFEAYATDAEVARFVIWRPHETIEDTHRFLKHFETHTQDGYPWIMTLRESGVLIGAMHLRVKVPWAEFGFTIARPQWGLGYGTEAVRSVVDFGLALPGVHRVQAMCHVDNGASARVMEKSGMLREGVLRRYMLFPNIAEEPQDVFVYAKTR